MSTRTLFETEEKIIEESQALVADPAHSEDPLFNDFKKLSRNYKKLFKQLARLIKLNDKQQYQLSDVNSTLKDLLDNTGEGFFSFGANYAIDPAYSKACETFFQQSIASKNALNLMFPENPTAVQELLDMVFSGISDFGVLQDLCPKEITIDGRILDIDYQWIPGLTPEGQPKEESNKMMIILSDITAERELEAQLKADEERNQTIIKIASDREGFLQLLRELNGLFDNLQGCLTLSPEKIEIDELFRYFHTIKGGASSYALTKVAEKAHQIESGLEEVRTGVKAITSELVIEIREKTNDLKAELKKTLEEFSQVIPQDELDQTEKNFRLSQSKIQGHQDYLVQELGTEFSKQIEEAIRRLCKEPIGQVFRKYTNSALDLADTIGKKIDVVLSGQQLEVSYDFLEDFFATLIHLVRNSVDHGMETPDIRVMLDKPETGILKIGAEQKDHNLLITIADDGGGIDPEHIKEVALNKELITLDEAQSISDEEIVALIFEPGFSTKEEVSSISGRGVGMDAVKFSAEKLGGRLEIKTELNHGTTFLINIPHVF